MYSVNWNVFANMDHGGSTPKYKNFRRLTIARKAAMEISRRVMVPGAVYIRDEQGRTCEVYQQGKKTSP
jgi:hypothetical protein